MRTPLGGRTVQAWTAWMVSTSRMTESPKPDFKAGVPITSLADGAMLRGRIDGEDAILVRQGGALHALGALCTHYHAELAEGLLDGPVLHCPMHHASSTSAAARRCARRRWTRCRVGVSSRSATTSSPASASSVHRGRAGTRRWPTSSSSAAARPVWPRPTCCAARGTTDAWHVISADGTHPRPAQPLEGLPRRQAPARLDAAARRRLVCRAPHRVALNTRVTAIDVGRREVGLESGAPRAFGALLLATGADPVRLAVPGRSTGQVHDLRSFADGRAIGRKRRGRAGARGRGASFIGLEVAASLRAAVST